MSYDDIKYFGGMMVKHQDVQLNEQEIRADQTRVILELLRGAPERDHSVFGILKWLEKKLEEMK